MHYYMASQIHRRAAEGIHWNYEAVPMQVNVIAEQVERIIPTMTTSISSIRSFSSRDVFMINSALWDINRWGQGGTCHF